MVPPLRVSWWFPQIETEQDPVGPSQVQKPCCVIVPTSPTPHFLFAGKRLQPPRTSLSSKGQIQTVCD